MYATVPPMAPMVQYVQYHNKKERKHRPLAEVRMWRSVQQAQKDLAAVWSDFFHAGCMRQIFWSFLSFLAMFSSDFVEVSLS